LKPLVNIFWFRRDLRLDDNAGLYHALKEVEPVLPLFIFDRNILDELEDKDDRRVRFIHSALKAMHEQLQEKHSSLDVRYGFPKEVFRQLMQDYRINKVFTNHDYEPYARERDAAIAKLLSDSGITFHSFKDQVIFERNEVVKNDGNPYSIYTPYARKWKSVLNDSSFRAYPCKKYATQFFQQSTKPMPTLESLGFTAGKEDFPKLKWSEELIKNYKKDRDTPGIAGTSRLGPHLRFGTLSIRELARTTGDQSETFLNELIWREFYQMILWHFPQVIGHAFKPAYDRINWRNNDEEFVAWCNGQTGYPIVDAGMRELNATGFMHNRVRMITASFLSKHLLVDWRWGEAYFAKKLLDFDLASNNGGWQWSAGCGCDAAPYFRVFNPYLQTKKFDSELKYIGKWVPEWESPDYPSPIVDHEFARKRCLERYSAALKK